MSIESSSFNCWGKPKAAITSASSGAKPTKAGAARRVPIDPQNPAVAPFIENGRVMLLVRFIAESLGLEVTFGTEDLNGAKVQRFKDVW